MAQHLEPTPPVPQDDGPFNNNPNSAYSPVNLSLQAHFGIGKRYYYNHERYHESLNNLTLADVYNGRGTSILRMRWKIKQQTLNQRRWLHRQNKVA